MIGNYYVRNFFVQGFSLMAKTTLREERFTSLPIKWQRTNSECRLRIDSFNW